MGIERPLNLFEDAAGLEPRKEHLGPGAMILREFALQEENGLLAACQR